MRYPLWSCEEVAEATGARITGAENWEASGVAIDTRSLAKGDLFIGLVGKRDGADYANQALAKGAASLLLQRRPTDLPADAPLLLVDNTLTALQDLARAARARSQAKIIAITGSVGKTTTKEMLRLALEPYGKVHTAERSHNNHIGVPLTLARLPQDADYAVIEIGMNHAGEIEPLSRLARPHLAMITLVAEAHKAAFNSLEEIAEAKAEIFSGLTRGGVIIFPAACPFAKLFIDKAAQREPRRAVLFGDGESADLAVIQTHPKSQKFPLRATIVERDGPEDRQTYELQLAAHGQHLIHCALAALSVLVGLRLEIAEGVTALVRWRPLAGRGRLYRLNLTDGGKIVLIDESYNANPASVAAALAAFVEFDRQPAGRRLAVLADMLELGDEAEYFHKSLAMLPAIAQIDSFYLSGKNMRALYNALPAAKRGYWAKNWQELYSKLRVALRAQDEILIKGSHGSDAHQIVAQLMQEQEVAPKCSTN